MPRTANAQGACQEKPFVFKAPGISSCSRRVGLPQRFAGATRILSLCHWNNRVREASTLAEGVVDAREHVDGGGPAVLAGQGRGLFATVGCWCHYVLPNDESDVANSEQAVNKKIRYKRMISRPAAPSYCSPLPSGDINRARRACLPGDNSRARFMAADVGGSEYRSLTVIPRWAEIARRIEFRLFFPLASSTRIDGNFEGSGKVGLPDAQPGQPLA
jgi:hypothetical protein